ncbi:MAG: cytidyltransferase, partial [Elusimicrobiota bacterium]
LYYKEGNFYTVPALAWKIVDTIGAGDAVLAITSPLSYVNVAPEMIAFIGNCAGALAVQYLGNKEVIEPADLIKLIQSFLK